ncbi:LysE family translocator [Acinetobacter lactucae]|uniref:LysE family translocator n=1 Tax=Acinetobacter lactucae TaxID=1785128 RepID=UPI00157FE724|nr:LysE family translocator [Acinetobacter lactucae]NUF36913.1 LysE family translocator [Acinetobacter lactucae]
MQISIEFLVTSFIVVISPGSGAIYTIATGLIRGGKASLFAAVGCTLGIIPHMVLAIAGLALMFVTSPYLFTILKFLGVSYLLYMAWSSLKEKGTFHFEQENKEYSAFEIINYAVFINLFNPKLPLFFFAFLPQFVRTDTTTPTWDMLLLGAIFMLITLVVFMFYGTFAAMMRQHVVGKPVVLKWLRRSFALGFIGLGVKLLFSSKS